MNELPVSDVLAKYKMLIHRFINREISAPEFESCYLKMFKNETAIFGEHVFDILEYLFTSADGYVADPQWREELRAANPDLRKYGQYLDDDELRADAREAYRQLFGG